MIYKIRLNSIEKVKIFCDAAEKVDVEIYVRQGEYDVLATSIMGIFSLNLLEDLELVIEPNVKVGEINEFINTLNEKGLII